MGLIVWAVAGIVVGIGARVACRVVSNPPDWPLITTGLVGGILGGFAADLAMRGDSVMSFRGPTLIGAFAGAIVVVAAPFLFSWIARAHRPA